METVVAALVVIQEMVVMAAGIPAKPKMVPAGAVQVGLEHLILASMLEPVGVSVF
jgi:hypothetical protein